MDHTISARENCYKLASHVCFAFYHALIDDHFSFIFLLNKDVSGSSGVRERSDGGGGRLCLGTARKLPRIMVNKHVHSSHITSFERIPA